MVGFFFVVLFFVAFACTLGPLHGGHPLHPFTDSLLVDRIGGKPVCFDAENANRGRCAIGLATIQHDINGIVFASVARCTNVLKSQHFYLFQNLLYQISLVSNILQFHLTNSASP